MLVASLSCAAWFGHRHGKQYALGAGMVASLLSGTWFEIEILGTPINVTMATAIILLSVYTLHSWRSIFKTINLLDVVLAAMVIWHFFVDVYYGGEPFAIAAQAYGAWMLPYAAGRYTFLHPGSLTKLSPMFVGVACIISLAAIYESFTSTNLLELIFASIDDEVRRPSVPRYEILYRAVGPVRHPIFLGIVLVLMIPWGLALLERTERCSSQQGWALLAVLILILGVAATVSRGPMLEILIAIAFAMNIRFVWLRWITLPSAVICTLMFIALPTQSTAWLEKATGDNTYRNIIQVDGQAEIYSSTRGRLFVNRLYGPAFKSAGLIGYGTDRISGDHPDLPYPAEYREVYSKLNAIDNSWLLLGLRFGWIGVALFAMLFTITIATLIQMIPTSSTYLFPNGQIFIIAFAAILFATGLEILTVFWAYDFSFWILFHIGVVAGLRVNIKTSILQ